MAVHYYTVTEYEAGQRIDNFLLKYFKKVPKSVIYRIVRKGEVRVDRKRVKPDYKLRLGESIRIPPVKLDTESSPAVVAKEASAALLQLLEKSVLLEDDYLIVLNKPAGLPVHGGSGVAIGLIEAFRQLRPHLPFVELVHRLDRDTSGLILLAKSRQVLNALHALLREGGMDKYYLALVAGRWQGGVREVTLDLQREPGSRRKVQVVNEHEGKSSSSIFAPQKRYADSSLLEVNILTGRMHQIRVQLAHLGYPVLGDDRYGDFKLNRAFRERGLKRLFLHAVRLEFMLDMNGHKYRLQAPLPRELEAVLRDLGKNI
ncbi:MAG: 23S rRNA pseudouridine(955/2504/2580) synthase [Proteobacteria bacterium]|nr:MAG: 23S rRNA pseudouridine(955/2504/2580) synthase [Pseudomonadota bacterium]